MRFETMHDGGQQLVLRDRSNWEEFMAHLTRFETMAGVEPVKMVDDFDDAYWHFKFEGVSLILAYSNFLGISIYPLSKTEAGSHAMIKLMAVLEEKGQV